MRGEQQTKKHPPREASSWIWREWFSCIAGIIVFALIFMAEDGFQRGKRSATYGAGGSLRNNRSHLTFDAIASNYYQSHFSC
jgi:hypothetical protein